MGFQYEFNWMLKLSDLDDKQLQLNKKYPFVKAGARVFPIDMPLDLVNGNWEAVARCIIDQITITSDKTVGKYKVVEIYDAKKRELLTEQWRSLLKTTKNIPAIGDYSKVHIT